MLFFCFVNMFFTLLMAKNRPTLCKEIRCTILFGENMKIAPNIRIHPLLGSAAAAKYSTSWMNESVICDMCIERESATSFRYPHPQGSPPRSTPCKCYILDPPSFPLSQDMVYVYVSMLGLYMRLVQMQVMLSWLDLHRGILTFTSFFYWVISMIWQRQRKNEKIK